MEKVREIIEILEKKYPNAKTALKYSNPLQLLVATILSAQCTDERVNKVTTELFRKYKTAKDYANVNIKTFENEIKSTGFYHNKARNIINTAKLLVEKYNGKVPKKMDELLKLPGVSRKTANVVLSSAYGIVEGIVVDTHVHRVSQRLGLTENKDPFKIETDLMKIVPKEKWHIFPFLLINYGREICKAKNPICEKCIIKKYCITKEYVK